MFGDLTLSFATFIAFMTNTLGVNDQVVAAFKAAYNGADDALLDLRIWFGTQVSKPLSTFMFVNAVVLAGIVGFASFVHGRVLTAEEQAQGIFPLFLALGGGAVLTTILWGMHQRRLGTKRFKLGPNGRAMRKAGVRLHSASYRPTRVSIFISCAILIASVMVTSIVLSMHALYVESRALWLISMLTRYYALMVTAATLAFLSWFVNKSVGFVEKLMQNVIEPIVSLAPGITLQNVTAKLFPNGLDIINQQYWAGMIALATSVFAVILIPFDLLVFLNPTTMMATVVGGAYVFSVIVTYPLYAVGLEDFVNESRDRLLKILFTWGKWVMVLILLPMGTFFSSQLSNGLKARWQITLEWFSDLLQGRVFVVAHHHWFWSVLALIGLLIVLSSVLGAAKEWSRLVKTLVYLPIGLAITYFVIALPVGWNEEPGWTPFSPHVAKTPDEEIKVIGLQAIDMDNNVLVVWTTDKPAECRVEIKELRDAGGNIVSLTRGVPSDNYADTHGFLQAIRMETDANGQSMHKVQINNLQPGWSVKYRIWSKHITRDRRDGMWPDQDPEWHAFCRRPSIPVRIVIPRQPTEDKPVAVPPTRTVQSAPKRKLTGDEALAQADAILETM